MPTQSIPATAPRAKAPPKGLLHRFFEHVVLPYKGDDCLIWPFGRIKNGYPVFGRRAGATRYLHRACCAVVNGQPPTSKHEAAHTCGKGHLGCVTPSHLAWKTPTENQADRVEHGTTNRGERQGSHKLTEDDVDAILMFEGHELQRVTAERFGIGKSHISQIRSGKVWGWRASGSINRRHSG